MPAIAVRDTTIYYEQAGQGPALLFIHGMCGDARVWAGQAGQAGRLAGRFSCVSYDRRGHTRSAPGTEPESVATHAADAAALIEALELARPVVVGSSGGARIAVELARTRPGLLAGAVFSEPPIFTMDPAAGQAFMTEVAAVVRPAAQTGGPPRRWTPSSPSSARACGPSWTRPPKDRYRANGPMMLAEFAGPPYQLGLNDAAGIALPSLVIAGTESHPALRAIAATLARALPDARLVQLAGSGHVTYAERPDQFAQAVAAFATEVTSRQHTQATHI